MARRKTTAYNASLELVRRFSGEQGTLSEIFATDAKGVRKRKCYAVELPWKNNEKRVSCIPDGSYPLIFKKSGRFYNRYKAKFKHQFILEIGRVPDGRYAILMHIANYPLSELLGCVAPCRSFKTDTVDPDDKEARRQLMGTSSAPMFDMLMKWCQKHRPSHIVVSNLDDAMRGWIGKSVAN